MNPIYPVRELTAGEDQLPQESANVTNGSDNSNPKALRAIISSFFIPFAKVWWEIINKVYGNQISN